MKPAALLAFFVVPLALLGQQAEPKPEPKPEQKPAEPAKTEEAKPKPEAAPAEAASTEAAPPQPAGEAWFTGFVDVGYRWRTDVAGSFDTYRSIVNLGEGPKLLGAEFTIVDPKHRLFDRIDTRAYNWGDDPYTTLHVTAQKARKYVLNADYRNIAYFNAPPSFANPLLAQGILLNQRSFDVHTRIASFDLDLLPGNWWTPYFSYDHNSEFGNGVTTFVTDSDEFPVPNRIRSATDNYRGGVRFELRLFHATLEQGGTTFKDDQQVYSSSGVVNPGNNLKPTWGQQLYLNSLQEAYGIRGHSIYSKGLFTSRPFSWLDVYGQFLFSQPETETNYQYSVTGNFIVLSQAYFYLGQQYLLTAQAKLPHTAGSAGVEVRPFKRVRIVQNWLTDRLHNNGASQATQTYQPPPFIPFDLPNQLATLSTTYNELRTDVLFDVTKKLTLRGGFRYVWGDSSLLNLPVQGLVSLDQAQLRRSVGSGGFTYRPTQKWSVHGSVDAASSNQAYFRTSLYNYQRANAKATYQANESLNLTVDYSILNNENPNAGINYSYRSQQASAAILWTPKFAKRVNLQGSYTRATVRSDITYYIPQILQTDRSYYRDDAHLATVMIETTFPGKVAAKLSAGGNLFISSGSRPTQYYQPLVKLVVPVTGKISWVSDWHYYGMGEAFYLYEGFRTHLFTTGLRFSR
jgi:hypothetical protein